MKISISLTSLTVLLEKVFVVEAEGVDLIFIGVLNDFLNELVLIGIPLVYWHSYFRYYMCI